MAPGGPSGLRDPHGWAPDKEQEAAYAADLPRNETLDGNAEGRAGSEVAGLPLGLSLPRATHRRPSEGLEGSLQSGRASGLAISRPAAVGGPQYGAGRHPAKRGYVD